MSEWMEICVAVEAAHADDIAALLPDHVDAARSGVQIRGNEIVIWTALAHCEQSLAEARAACEALARAGLPVSAASVKARPAVPESEWRDAWKRYFQVTRITRQVVIVPSWHTYEPRPDDIVLHLDPGQAFGTGAHASTRLLLEELQTLRDDGAQVATFCDVGTGSGVLAIAAARLWPGARGRAVDIDPLAVAASRENAERNGVADRVVCTDAAGGPGTADDAPGAADAAAPASAPDSAGGAYDLVLANIQASVLGQMCDTLLAATRPVGHNFLSGLLTPQAAPLASRFERAGASRGVATVRVRPSDADPAWSCAVLRVG